MMLEKPSEQKIYTRYTLIELMVTITIIGILLTMLLSAMKVGKDKIKEMQCLDNLKAHGVAIGMYAGDNYNDLVPASQHYLGKDTISFDDLLSHYMGRGYSQDIMEANTLYKVGASLGLDKQPDVSHDVIQCPNDKNSLDESIESVARTYVMNGVAAGSDLKDADGDVHKNYLFYAPDSGTYMNRGPSNGRVKPFKMSQLPDPSGTIIMTEYQKSNIAGRGTAVTTSTFSGAGASGQKIYHGDPYAKNFLLGDGRAQYLQEEELGVAPGGMWSMKAGD